MNSAYRAIEEGMREEILREVGRSRWRLWFRDTAVHDLSEHALTLAVPSEVHRTWLEYTYGDLLRRAARAVLGDGTEVRLEVSPTQGARREIRDRLPGRNAEWETLVQRRRPRPDLQGFVAEGKERFAPLLLEQIVHGHGRIDPPAVYLYGEAGSGKTHLLRALLDAVERRRPGDALYLTSRRFTSRYVSAVRSRELGAVRAFEADLCHRRLVLLDDIHALAGRTATQAALVRLRERTVGSSTRFVFAGALHPRDLERVSGRFASWLSSGVVLRLGLPRTDRLRAILQARARGFGTSEVPEAVLDWILERTGSVHGAIAILDRWAAASAELDSPLDLEWMPEIAPRVSASTRQEVVRRAKEVVAHHYGIPPTLLDAPTKLRSAARPRRVAMYLVYRAAALPLKDLGRAFGLRSHSSVSRAIHVIRAQRDREPALEHEIDGLLARM